MRPKQTVQHARPQSAGKRVEIVAAIRERA